MAKPKMRLDENGKIVIDKMSLYQTFQNERKVLAFPKNAKSSYFKGSSESELQTQVNLFLKSMSERGGSDIERL